jgi:uncharacterized protein YndB with AHSA1/START domain
MIVALGVALSLRTIAEGIERQEQAAALASMGWTFARASITRAPSRRPDGCPPRRLIGSGPGAASARLSSIGSRVRGIVRCQFPSIGGSMPLSSFEPLLVPRTPFATFPTAADGPLLEQLPPLADTTEPALRIRARRAYPVSRGDLFAAWTRRTAWDSWMRLRARSRTTLSPYRGGAFRLELAEGATIHVVTGCVRDVRPEEILSLSWLHHTKSERASVVDVTFRSRQGASELSIVHGSICSRREAAWLMRLWSAVLDRLASYLEDGASPALP